MNTRITSLFANTSRTGNVRTVLAIAGFVMLCGIVASLTVNQPGSSYVTQNASNTNHQPAKPLTPVTAVKTSSQDATEADTRVAITENGVQQPANTTPVRNQSKSAPIYDNSTMLPPLKVAPMVYFSLTISPWSVTHLTANIFQVPFALKHSENHTAPINSLIGQVMPAVPGLSCTPFFVGQDYGEIRVIVPNTAPNGQYTCQVTLSDGTISRTSQFTFTTTDGFSTTP